MFYTQYSVILFLIQWHIITAVTAHFELAIKSL